jgi:6-phosphogluconolactonase/glucosamine-6-phosphate isomerase/deaminase
MRVFISYHSSRQRTVEHVATYLSKRGIDSWYAARDITSGTDWDTSITEGLSQCDALILLFCAQADASRHVKREIHLADQSHIPIHWLRLERVEPQNLSYYLGTTQWIDWLDERDITLESLVKALDSGQSTPGAAKAATVEPVGEPPASWPSQVFSFDSIPLAAEAAARIYFEVIKRRPDQTVVLPTGRAATHLFRGMIKAAPDYLPRPFGEVPIITDTETFGVFSGHPTSRTRHVKESLIQPLQALGLGPDQEQLHLLSGLITETDPILDARQLLRSYPPSVHGISVAPSGEALAFEVGSYADEQTLAETGPRVIEVAEHGRSYIDPDQPSKSVLSVGLGTALNAEVLLVLGYDRKKSAVLRRMMRAQETAGVPATVLRRHGCAYLITTHDCSERLEAPEITSNYTPREAAEWVANRL